MLNIIYGGDAVSRKTKYQKIIDSAVKGGALLVSMDDTDIDLDFLRMSSHGGNLFADKYVVLLNGIFEREELLDVIFDTLPQFKDSTNVFIFNEPTLVKENLKKFEKAKAEIIDCGKKVSATKARFNTFALTDAMGARDRKMSWIIFNSAISSNIAPEEINGVLFWMVKGMILSHKENNLSAEETGLSSFVYQKAKRSSTNFTLSELENMSRELVSLYHLAHRGEVDFEAGLELFLLKSI